MEHNNTKSARRLGKFWIGLLLVGLLTQAACGDDPKPGEVGRVEGNNDVLVNNEPNNDAPNNDVNNDAPVARVAAFVEVRPDPLRAVFAPGLNVLPTATVLDQFGEPLETEVRFKVEPEGATTFIPDTGRFKLEQEGALTLIGCADGADGAEVCGDFELIVDAAPPKFVELDPAPGSMLLAADHPEPTLTGRVVDTHGELRAFVNGRQVELDEEGRFSVALTPRFGTNHIDLSATDGFQAAETRSGLDFVWAQDFHPAGIDDGGQGLLSGVSYDRGVALRLGQRFMDDGQPLMINDEATQIRTEDLASILELVIHELDVMSQIPDPIIDSDIISLRITSVRFKQPEVEIQITDEGLELFVRFRDVRVGTSGQFSFEGTDVDLTGGITATVSAFARMTLNKPDDQSDYNVAIDSLELAFESAQSQFAAGEANAIFDLAQSALRGLIEDTLLGAVEGSFLDALPQTLLSVFQTLENQLDGLSFNLETGLGPAVEMSVAARIVSLVPVPGSHIGANIAVSVATGTPAVQLDAPGVPLDAPDDAAPPFFNSSPLQIALPMGLLNGLLYTFWDAGILEINVFDVLPMELSFLLDAATISAKLPPVITVPTPEQSASDLLITLGQMELLADFGDKQDTYGFNITVGAEVGLEGGAISLSINPEPRITAWLVGTTGDTPGFDADGLKQVILSQLWPQLESLVDVSLSLPLPAVELGGTFGTLAPSLSDMSLEIVLNRPLDVRGGHIIMDASWQGVANLVPDEDM